jgi:hypothetical protein
MRVLLFVLLALVGGCGEVFEYPDAAVEGSEELCRDGRDSDVDGATDCDDPDCDGFCPEETRTECDDGRDNDGDGVADADDPRCWPHTPPVTQRCAKSEGAEFTDHFDVSPTAWSRGATDVLPGYDWPWAPWGFDGDELIVKSRAYSAGERRDLLVTFEGTTTGSDPGDSNLGALVRQLPFSGSWQDFELGFSAYVPEGAVLRAGIVPLKLSPSSTPPAPGAEKALVSVSLDASRSPPVLTLSVEGKRFATPLPAEAPDEVCGEAACAESMVSLRVTAAPEGLLARIAHPNGATTELTAPAPSSPSLPPARLVFWGGSRHGARGVLLDDLRASIQPELPCGIVVPQIPSDLCQAGGDVRAYGYSTAVARGASDYCAVIVTSGWDGTTGSTPPNRTSVWNSQSGEDWKTVGTITPPQPGLTVVGAGIASSARGDYHVVTAYRDDAAPSTGVRLMFLDAQGCGYSTAASALEPALPLDVEAPSYVIRDDRHEVYFTRPPTNVSRRTLWRVLRDGAEPPEQLAELPPGVGQPVSVQLAGSIDLVVAYPSTADSGGKGVGLLVADESLHDWQKVSSTAVLTLPPSPDLPSGLGRLGFDDREVFSAALSWQPNGRFLLYGARSSGGFRSGENGTPVLTVGMARIAPAGHVFPQTARVPEPTCGDGSCSSSESCSSCEADCLCSGVEVFRGTRASVAPWKLSSSAPDPRALSYFNTAPTSMTLRGGEPTWSSLELEHPINGDFELSFDVLVEPTDFGPLARAYVGLGTAPESSGATFAPRAGAFALVSACPETFHTAPIQLLDGTPRDYETEAHQWCWDWIAQLIGSRHHVALSRQGTSLQILVQKGSWQLEMEGLAPCGLQTRRIDYQGALPPLTHLLAGFGGPGYHPNPSGSNPVTIENLVLRVPESSATCTAPKQLCSDDPVAATCVDTRVSNEHCGACDNRCATNEACTGGVCVCTKIECDGTCVDPDTSSEHCGGCGQACDERCVGGTCVAGAVTAGDCSAPFTIPATGGDVSLVLTPYVNSGYNWCNTTTMGELVGSFTPERSGTVVIETTTDELDPVVAITDDAACSEWLACNDDITLGEVVESQLRFDVVAGTTYRIGVGMWDYALLDDSRLALSIEFE